MDAADTRSIVRTVPLPVIVVVVVRPVGKPCPRRNISNAFASSGHVSAETSG